MHWRVKAPVQRVVGLLPMAERVNYGLQVLNGSFRPDKTNPDYRRFLKRVAALDRRIGIQGRVVLKIGAGWTAPGAFLLHLFGASTVYTYDLMNHVRFDLIQGLMGTLPVLIDEEESITHSMAGSLKMRLDRLMAAQELGSLLKLANIALKAPADATRSGLPDNSVDLIFSHGVLEHVPEKVLEDLIRESKRILSPGGFAYHCVIPGDHFYQKGRGICTANFLQYSDWAWRFWGCGRLNYQTRLREKQYINAFRSHGAAVEVVANRVDAEAVEAVRTMRLNPRFAGLSPEELAVDVTELLYWFDTPARSAQA